MGERDIQEGGDVCICKPDLLLCTAETNKTLQSNYTLKNFFNNETKFVIYTTK